MTSRAATGPRSTTRRAGTAQIVLVLGALIALGPLSIPLSLPAFPGIAEEFSSHEASVLLTLPRMFRGRATGPLNTVTLSAEFGRHRHHLTGLPDHPHDTVLDCVT